MINEGNKLPNLFSSYRPFENNYDEYFQTATTVRSSMADIIAPMKELALPELKQLHGQVREEFRKEGITFRIYSNQESDEHIFPFDLLPRIITVEEWKKIEQGLIQRIHALNVFLEDIYGRQHILKEQRIPNYLISSCKEYLPKLRHCLQPERVSINIAGCDLVRNVSGEFYVLEDNLRCPSGVSYLINNRKVMKKFLPEWMQNIEMHEVELYPQKLKSTLQSLARTNQDSPFFVILTPGTYNAAYYEHCFLARQMGCPLVENHELFVSEKNVFWHSVNGPQKVDVIYRRTDDQFLDPTFFRKDSLLGISGLVEAYLAGNVVLANAPGNGVADDKAIYHYVPEMINYYLNEEPILPQISTYIAADKKECKYILAHLKELVIKMVNQSGGYGMVIGPQASQKELEEIRQKIIASPRSYIAQHLIELSSMPTLTNEQLRPHRVDLRVYVLSGKNQSWVLPGALTRVALKENSYIVNSSQGGGSKDTWVLK
jgi:uncharacterized circularly permuted ATP-grasp superfamily protein